MAESPRMRRSLRGHRGSRILIVRIGAMGDILHALPAVAGLRSALPDAEIGWVVEPRWLPLLESVDGSRPLVDRVHLANTRAWKEHPLSFATAKDLLALRGELEAARYDVAIDLQGSIRSAVLGRMASAERFVGPATPREWPAGLFYDEHVALTQPNVIDQAGEILSAALDTLIRPAGASLPLYPASAQPEGFILIAPTAGWGAKEWPASQYAALAAALIREGHRVVVNAAFGAESVPADLIARESGAAILPTTLPELVGLTRRAALVIGGDTGPVHVGALLGRPTLALFGPTDPARNGPAFPGARVTVLRHPSSVTDHRRHRATEAGLARVRVEEVLAAARALLAARGD